MRPPEDRAERGAGEEQRADEQQQRAEDRRAGGADRDADGAAEHLAEIAALVAAERDHQPEGEDAEPHAERAHVDERAARDHQAADGDERDRQPPRGAADQRVEAVDERAADVAAVPADVEDAAEEEPERDEAEAPELRVVEAPRLRGLRGGLLPPGADGFRTQRALALLARHEGPFARAAHAPSPRG